MLGIVVSLFAGEHRAGSDLENTVYVTPVWRRGWLCSPGQGEQEGKGGGGWEAHGIGPQTVHQDHLGSWLKSKFVGPVQKFRFRKVGLG